MNTITISKTIAQGSYRISISALFIRKLSAPILNWLKRVVNSVIDNYANAANASIIAAKTYTPEIAEKEILSLRKFLPRIRKYVARLEAVNFFNDKDIEEKADAMLDKLYDLDTRLAIIAFQNRKKQGTDYELTKAIIAHSITTVTLALEKEYKK